MLDSEGALMFAWERFSMPAWALATGVGLSDQRTSLTVVDIVYSLECGMRSPWSTEYEVTGTINVWVYD